MVKKTCPSCGKDSYSAAEHGTWICPYCQEDISSEPAQPVNKSATDEPTSRE